MIVFISSVSWLLPCNQMIFTNKMLHPIQKKGQFGAENAGTIVEILFKWHKLIVSKQDSPVLKWF